MSKIQKLLYEQQCKLCYLLRNLEDGSKTIEVVEKDLKVLNKEICKNIVDLNKYIPHLQNGQESLKRLRSASSTLSKETAKFLEVADKMKRKMERPYLVRFFLN